MGILKYRSEAAHRMTITQETWLVNGNFQRFSKNLKQVFPKEKLRQFLRFFISSFLHFSVQHRAQALRFLNLFIRQRTHNVLFGMQVFVRADEE